MTARKHQALGKGLGALFPTEMKIAETPQEETLQDSDTDKEAREVVESQPMKKEGAEKQKTEERKKSLQNPAKSDAKDNLIPKEMENGIVVQQIPVADIQANRYQPRQEFDESALEELKESIVQHGVLQPILVRQLPAGKGYELIAGERRFRAAKLAGFDTVPALVRPLSDAASTEIALIENLQREDLNAIEEARAYQNLLQNFGLTQEALAERVGRSRSHITNMMRLLKLDARVQEYLANGSLSMGQARPLVVLTDADLQREAADLIMARECSARQAEELVKRLQKSAEEAQEGEKEKPSTERIFLQEAEDKLKMFFGTQVRIRAQGKKNRIEIDFSSEEDLNRILDSLLEKKSRVLEDKKAALRQFSAGERFTV
ncbi:ParB/RepB/Spo0J family partition protein [uncultured Selenomonas sp.]|uniref:ParB/RepB/Spo0J family partition protein n=2 Tax=uncultured Selenomonas sp. TaxID=159275 RepID=UPI0028DCA54E|nr:ParB/RepB/Spo0J family partition protein [uncultured Selenomonas sp.]